MAADGLFGVEPVSDTGGGAAGLSGGHGAVALGERGVDGLPVFQRQRRRLGGDEQRLVLVENAAAKGAMEVRHLAGEHRGQPDESGTDPWADPAGQADLGADVTVGPLPGRR